MRSRFLFQVISVIVMALVAFSASARMVVPANDTKSQTILVFGDSLSAGYGVPQGQGWVALLEKKLAAEPKYTHYKVINASISGETTSGGLARIKQALLVHKPNIVIIELGANDGLRGLQVIDVQQNLNTMISQAKTANAKVLLIGMKIPPNYGLKYTKNFSAMYSNLAKQHKISLVPFLLENVAGKPELIQADGLHPLAVAQPKLLENVWIKLIKMLSN
jgi:acyl-CoA thioesterase I